MSNIEGLARSWLEAKRQEAEAQANRRAIEDQLVDALDVPDSLDGTANHEAGDYAIKVVGRMTRKVDADKVQEIAAEQGTSDHLSRLFRWKPEMNVSVWKNTDVTITTPLLGGITSKPGRPSFNISLKGEK